MTRSPGAVIFDLDGLMLDSERMYRDAWQGAAEELGYRIDDDLYQDLIGRGNADGEAILARKLGEGFSLDAFRRAWLGRWRDAVRANGIPVKPGLPELLAFLEKNRVPRAVATTGRRRGAELKTNGRTSAGTANSTSSRTPVPKPATSPAAKARARQRAAPTA